MLRLYTFLLAFFASGYSYGQLIIIPESDPVKLSRNLVGAGVYITNVTLNASPLATGIFYNRGGTAIGIDSGIVLSSGRVLTEGSKYGLNAPQPVIASSDFLAPGDMDLLNLAGVPTSDAAVLEFDFVPTGNVVQFRYVFSSEEYPHFVCSNYNDAFGFFIQGPGITGKQNLALVPGTDIPVAINSINHGIAGSTFHLDTCKKMGPGSPFTQYYHSNHGNVHFSHNGHTVILTATIQVIPCETYHLKIAISDGGITRTGTLDRRVDSGIFLEAKSLSSSSVNIINLGTTQNDSPYLAEGCSAGRIRIVASSKEPVARLVRLSYGGQAINGADVGLLPATVTIPANDSAVELQINALPDNLAEGNEMLRIYATMACVNSGFFADSVSIMIRDYDTLAIDPSVMYGLCKRMPVQVVADASYDTYSWSPVTGVNNPQVHNPVIASVTDMAYTCIATKGSCKAKDSIIINVKDIKLLSAMAGICSNTGATIAISTGPEWTRPVLYRINDSPFNSDSIFNGLPDSIHTVIAKDATGCEDTLVVDLSMTPQPLFVLDSIIKASCSGTGGKLMLSATGGVPPYQFSVNNSSYSSTYAYFLDAGQHQIAVKDANNCTTLRNITIEQDDSISTAVEILPATCSVTGDGKITIRASGGSGIYEYSINGLQYQPSNVFVLSSGPVTVFVRDNKSCLATGSFRIPQNNHLTIDLPDSAAICEGRSYRMPLNSNAASFTWSNGSLLDDANSMNPLAIPRTSALFTITATLGVCTRTDSIYLQVYKAPVAYAGNDTTICFGYRATLHGTGGTQFYWYPAASFSDPSRADPVLIPKKTEIYYLTVADDKGCRSLNADSIKVRVVPRVVLFAGLDTIMSINQTLRLDALDLQGSGVTRYSWSPAGGLSDPLIKNPVAIIDRDVTYTVTGTTPEGCSGQGEIRIRAIRGPELYVPTAFTPNNDGKNDFAKLIPVGISRLNYFRIYNRVGNLVFSATQAQTGWDGRIRGVSQEPEVFVWIAEGIDFNGKIIRRKGTITLLR